MELLVISFRDKLLHKLEPVFLWLAAAQKATRLYHNLIQSVSIYSTTLRILFSCHVGLEFLLIQNIQKVEERPF